MTAVEKLEISLLGIISFDSEELRVKYKEKIAKAKEMEQTNTDNKVIHFAEWLTNKHPLALIVLYEQFEEQFYNE